jgi:hypothetical protein
MKTKIENTQTEIPRTSPTYNEAHQQEREDLLALNGDILARRPRLDGGDAAETAEASAKKLMPYRAALVAEYGEPAGQLLDQLVPAARSAKQADLAHQLVTGSGDLSELEAKVVDKQKLLMTDAEALVNRKVFTERDLSAARPIKSHRQKCDSVLLLVTLFRQNWERVHDKTLLTEDDLHAAELVAQEMNLAIAYRDHGADESETGEMRNRALTKLVMVNEEIRRRMTFVRWYEEDVDEIVPSFWAGRSHGRKTETGEVESTTPATNEESKPAPAGPELDPTGEGGPFLPE